MQSSGLWSGVSARSHTGCPETALMGQDWAASWQTLVQTLGRHWVSRPSPPWADWTRRDEEMDTAVCGPDDGESQTGQVWLAHFRKGREGQAGSRQVLSMRDCQRHGSKILGYGSRVLWTVGRIAPAPAPA